MYHVPEITDFGWICVKSSSIHDVVSCSEYAIGSQYKLRYGRSIHRSMPCCHAWNPTPPRAGPWQRAPATNELKHGVPRLGIEGLQGDASFFLRFFVKSFGTPNIQYSKNPKHRQFFGSTLFCKDPKMRNDIWFKFQNSNVQASRKESMSLEAHVIRCCVCLAMRK